MWTHFLSYDRLVIEVDTIYDKYTFFTFFVILKSFLKSTWQFSVFFRSSEKL